MSARARTVALSCVLWAALAVFARILHAHQPFTEWLVVRYLVSWAATGTLVVTATLAGLAVVRRLRPRAIDDVALCLAFPAGLLVFQLVLFAIGLARAFGPVAFVGVPFVLFLLGRETLGELRAFVLARRPAPWSSADVACSAAGALGLVLLALPVLVPENVSYDARWYHLALAEHHAAASGLEPLPEGFISGGYPQLATLLYTWAFLLPGGATFDRVELAAHLELAAIVWTIGSIPTLVRALVPGAPTRRVWPVFFLFPGIFLYDSAPACGADHVAALFAVPILLSLLEAWARPATATFALAGAFVGGALATKYTAVVLGVAPLMALAALAVVTSVAAIRRGARADALSAFRLPLVALLAVGLVTAPHWLRNWLFYGDPVYPMLARAFGAHPWGPHADAWYARFLAIRNIPGAEPPRGLADTLVAMLTFSVKPHDWPHFHGVVPVFGSLFTIATAALVFLRETRRIWAVVVACHVALAVWLHMAPQDRYLQMFLPWMAAATAATGVLAWRTGTVVRVPLVFLALLQALWGATVYGFPAHAMTRRNALGLLGEHLRSWQRGATPDLLAPFPPFRAIAAELPRGARVLVHEMDAHLGLGVPTVNDGLPYQFGLDYSAAGDATAVYAALRAMRVTHVIFGRESKRNDSLAGDLAFYSFVRLHGVRPRTHGDLVVVDMPTEAPPRRPTRSVLVVACGAEGHLAGLYALADLAEPVTGADPPAVPVAPHRSFTPADLAAVAYVVRDPACALPFDPQRFTLTAVAVRGRYELSVRPRDAHETP